MEPSEELLRLGRSPGAASRPGNSFIPPQQHIQHSPGAQLLQHEYCHQSPLTQLDNQMSGMQLQHTPMTPGSFSHASGMSCQGPLAAHGPPRPGLMSLRVPQMVTTPLIPTTGKDHEVRSGQPPRMSHPWQQQGFSPPTLAVSFPHASHQQYPDQSTSWQLPHEGSEVTMAPQHLASSYNDPGMSGSVPPLPHQLTQSEHTARNLDPKTLNTLPSAIKVS